MDRSLAHEQLHAEAELSTIQPGAPSTELDASPEPTYTIIARSTTFTLTLSQISFDSPNFFTSAFLDHDFTEATTRTLRTDRSPALFAIIVEYLAGYEVLPLAGGGELSAETQTKNLQKDAEYFGLDGLSRQCRKALVAMRFPRATLPLKFTNYSEMIHWEDLLSGALKVEVPEEGGPARIAGVEGTPIVCATNVACS